MAGTGAATGKASLHKGLGLIHVFAIASGAMMSSGLFIIAGMAFERAGPAVVWSYLLAGILATAGALSIAELTTAMPKAGGDYFFITRGFGPGTGTVAGLLSWFSLSLKSSFAIVGMATFTALIVHMHGQALGAILLVVFVILNLVGVREAARVQVALVAGLFALLTLYVVVGFPRVEAERLMPFAPHGQMAVLFTTGFVFTAYGGLLNVASVAEEVRRPGWTIPVGLMLSLVFTTLLYTLAVFVTSGVVEAETLKGSLTPISDGGQVLMGRFGFIAMSIGAILAFVSTANAGIMAASRYLLALSRDRLLPRPLSAVSRRFRTPHIAIGITGVIIFITLFLRLDVLVEATSTVMMLANMMACLAVVALRESKLQNYRPAFRTPLYPFPQIVGVIGLAFVVSKMGIEAHLISMGLILTGFFTFWFYGRRRVRQESALLHLIERITAGDLTTGMLEQELKEIVHERDEIVLDRLDRLIEEAPVLDLETHLTIDEFVDAAADQLAPRLDVNADDLAKLLLKREEQGSTALGPFLAVPHVIMPGENKFELLIARARGGVTFSEEAPTVNAIFVLACTQDERNFYLRALAAIGHIVQEKAFGTRWMTASNEQALRDVLLLSSRGRHEPSDPAESQRTSTEQTRKKRTAGPDGRPAV